MKGHCSIEDSRAALDLFKLVEQDWRAWFSERKIKNNQVIPNNITAIKTQFEPAQLASNDCGIVITPDKEGNTHPVFIKQVNKFSNVSIPDNVVSNHGDGQIKAFISEVKLIMEDPPKVSKQEAINQQIDCVIDDAIDQGTQANLNLPLSEENNVLVFDKENILEEIETSSIDTQDSDSVSFDEKLFDSSLSEDSSDISLPPQPLLKIPVVVSTEENAQVSEKDNVIKLMKPNSKIKILDPKMLNQDNNIENIPIPKFPIFTLPMKENLSIFEKNQNSTVDISTGKSKTIHHNSNGYNFENTIEKVSPSMNIFSSIDKKIPTNIPDEENHIYSFQKTLYNKKMSSEFNFDDRTMYNSTEEFHLTPILKKDLNLSTENNNQSISSCNNSNAPSEIFKPLESIIFDSNKNNEHDCPTKLTFKFTENTPKIFFKSQITNDLKLNNNIIQEKDINYFS